MTQHHLFPRTAATVIAPGAVHLAGYLSLEQQQEIATAVLELGASPAGFYTPVVRGLHPMSVRMLCLGRHWNARTYTYDDHRTDVDGLPAPALPTALRDLATAAAKSAGFDVVPDLAIVNWYQGSSRMGLHQDKDESPASLESGSPVVSLSIGDTARFLFGGLKRKEPVAKLLLESGDAFVFGGPARLRYHGVSRILPGTAPAGLGFDGRLNLTFRKF